jgi:HKD family nuclease
MRLQVYSSAYNQIVEPVYFEKIMTQDKYQVII